MSDNLDELERLNGLRERGSITEQEFERAKRSILGEPEGTKRGLPGWIVPTTSILGILLATLVIKPMLRSEPTAAETMAGNAPASASDIEQLCIFAVFDKPQSLKHRVRELYEPAYRANRNVTWEATANGGIGRITWTDQLNQEDHEMAVEFVRMPGAMPMPDCDNATAGAVATRISNDGELAQGFAVSVALQQILAGR